MRFDAFVGGTSTLASANADAQHSINFYPELIESGQGKNRAVLVPTPGLGLYCSLATSPVRGIWSDDTRSFAVAGSKLYQLPNTVGGSATLIGDVGDDSYHTPVRIRCNGPQLAISSAGKLWIYDDAGLSQPTYLAGQATVNVSDIAGEALVNVAADSVTWVDWDKFSADGSWDGLAVKINGVSATISSVDGAGHLTLTTSPGDGDGQDMVVYWPVSNVYWVDGDKFPTDGSWDGLTCKLNGVSSTISTVMTEDRLVLTAPALDGTKVDMIVLSSDPVNATTLEFLDGYFIVVDPADMRKIQISGLYDGRSWDALDFAIKEAQSDLIANILVDHTELYLLGFETSECWRNEGGADFPFVRDPGAVMHVGCVAGFSAVSIPGSPNGVGILGGDERGRTAAWFAQGFIPKRVSTHAVEQAWSTYASIRDAISYAYSEGGHIFWVLTFPGAGKTWCYDVTSGAWHERASLNAGVLGQHRGICHSYSLQAEKHLVGDYAIGAIYWMSQSLNDDVGGDIRRVRVAPHIANEELWQFHHMLQLDFDSVPVNGKPEPTIVLDWSDDDGQTWATARNLALGPYGSKAKRARARRLGRARDRIYRATITGQTFISIVDAYLNLEGGAA